jgi:hypothetical protein
VHNPLTTSHIRLLVLQPGQHDSQITCYVHNASLERLPQYEAVSYAWGNSTETHNIQCNGQDLTVSGSLYQALRGVRLTDKPRVIWIDGLCIDQSNMGERSDQIQLMRHIFAKAKRVLIWLGSDSPGAGAFGFLEQIAESLPYKSRIIAALNMQS